LLSEESGLTGGRNMMMTYSLALIFVVVVVVVFAVLFLALSSSNGSNNSNGASSNESIIDIPGVNQTNATHPSIFTPCCAGP